MALEADDYNALSGHVNIFHIATILLEVRAYLCQSVLHLLLYGRFFLIGHGYFMFSLQISLIVF